MYKIFFKHKSKYKNYVELYTITDVQDYLIEYFESGILDTYMMVLVKLS